MVMMVMITRVKRDVIVLQIILIAFQKDIKLSKRSNHKMMKIVCEMLLHLSVRAAT